MVSVAVLIEDLKALGLAYYASVACSSIIIRYITYIRCMIYTVVYNFLSCGLLLFLEVYQIHCLRGWLFGSSSVLKLRIECYSLLWYFDLYFVF